MHLENIPLQWVILKGFEREPSPPPHLAHSLLSWLIRWKTFGSSIYIVQGSLLTTGTTVTMYLLMLLGRTLRNLNSRAQEPFF